jgi:L-seryl-tRNA(Ser) seleniumtransferase
LDLDRLRGTPLHGIGRGFKVGKEEIVGLLCALERFVSQDEAAQLRAWTSRLQSIAHGLVEANGLPVMLRQASSLQGVPCLELQTGTASREMCRRLRRLPRPVHLAESRLDEGLLMIQPIALQPEDDGLLAASIVEVWSAIMASEKSIPVADSSIDGLTGHSKHKDVAP